MTYLPEIYQFVRFKYKDKMVGFVENAVEAVSSAASAAWNFLTGSEPEEDPNADADPFGALDYIMIQQVEDFVTDETNKKNPIFKTVKQMHDAFKSRKTMYEKARA